MQPEEKLANKELDLGQVYPDLDNLTPILYAAKHGAHDFIEFCLSRASAIQRSMLLDFSNPAGLTALHYACLYGHVQTAKRLIEYGAPMFKTTSLQMLPIHMIFGDQNSVTSCEMLFHLFLKHPELMSKKTSSNETVAHQAASKGAVDILKVVKSIEPGLLRAKDNYSLTPLLRGVLGNQVEVVKYLLNHSDLNQKNSKGQNALHVAVLSSSVEMVTLLLPYFDSHTPDNDNHSSLHLAEIYGHKDKLDVMMNHSVSANSSGYSPK